MAFSIAIYEELAELSKRMLDAARDGDSAEIGRLSLCIAALQSGTANQSPLSGTDCSRAYRNTLLHRILDNDAQIRQLNSPLPPLVDAVLAAGSPGVSRGHIAATLR